jgi:hypothetical protein
MTELYCTWCMQNGHEKSSHFPAVVVPPEADVPSTADDVNDALQDRNLRLRAALRGVLVEARQHGVVLSPTTAALVAQADSFDP